MIRRMAWLLLLLLPCILPAQVLVANPDVPLRAIERSRARAYFFLRLHEWPDGTPVRLFVLDDRAPLHRRFSKEVLGVLPQSLRRTWDRMLFAGLAQPPERVGSIEEMRRRVATTPGALGYLPKGETDESVRVLPVH